MAIFRQSSKLVKVVLPLIPHANFKSAFKLTPSFHLVYFNQFSTTVFSLPRFYSPKNHPLIYHIPQRLMMMVGEEEGPVVSLNNNENNELIIRPPLNKGMTKLDKSLFNSTVTVPSLHVSELFFKNHKLNKSLKPFLLRLKAVKPIFDNEDESQAPKSKIILFEPRYREKVKEILDLESSNETILKSSSHTLNLTYDNWKWDEILESILPDDSSKFGGFTITGHLIHVNLREHLLPFKTLIAQVLLDKVPNCKTVVNKIESIENKYRNFSMEFIGGEEDSVVKVKENGLTFEFDFSTVYWNSRLSSEHGRIVSKYLHKNDLLVDVFGGVGPFSVPAAKKGAFVLANDLNPHSYKWLTHNVILNKVDKRVKCFNLDGREFIGKIFKDLTQGGGETKEFGNLGDLGNIHVTMNLPGSAPEFLPSFYLNLKNLGVLETKEIIIHVYCFIKAEIIQKEDALKLVNENLGYELSRDEIEEIFFVRNVAPNKDMYRVSFKLPKTILRSNSGGKYDEVPEKRAKFE